MVIPRPCSYLSETLSSTRYYVGDSALTYYIAEENDIDALTLSLLSENTQLVCMNGK